MKLDHSILPELRDLYNLDFQSLDSLHIGENQSFFLKTKSRDFVLKLYRKEREQRVDIHTEMALLKSLRAAGLKTLTIERSKNLKEIEQIKDQFIVLQHFCPGYMICSPTPGDYRNLGIKLRQLHQTKTSTMNVPALAFRSTVEENWGHIKKAPFLNTELIASLTFFKDLVRQRFHFIPESLIHFDLHWGNIILDDPEMTFLDWEECGIGNKSLDLGTINAHLLRRENGPFLLEALLAGYGSAIDPVELRLATMVKLLHLLGHIPTKLDMSQLQAPTAIFNRYLGYLKKLAEGL